MNRLYVSALAAAVLASPAAVLADSPEMGYSDYSQAFDDRWYVSPFASYTWADDDRGTDDGNGWGFAVGKPINEWFNVELRATYTNLVSEGAPSLGDVADLDPDDLRDRYNTYIDRGYVGQGDFEVADVAVDGLFFFSRGGFQPFLLAGLGAIHDDYECDSTLANARFGCKSGSAWSFMAEAGAGFLVPVGDTASIRVDGRYRYDDNNDGLRGASDFGDWIVTAGVYIPLGKRAARPTTRTFSLSADALFPFDRATLTPTGVSTINNFARDLDEVAYNSVRVEGHTDPLGSDAYNQDLSQRRADTVEGQLVSDGVPSDRISAQGYGESRLKVTEADCAGARNRAALIECYQPNRRVEVTVEGYREK
jgi:OOP family OmpA-OmpF porin